MLQLSGAWKLKIYFQTFLKSVIIDNLKVEVVNLWKWSKSSDTWRILMMTADRIPGGVIFLLYIKRYAGKSSAIKMIIKMSINFPEKGHRYRAFLYVESWNGRVKSQIYVFSCRIRWLLPLLGFGYTPNIAQLLTRCITSVLNIPPEY